MAIYLKAPQGKSKVLTFSYDDGVEQDIRLVKILNEHGMKGTFNINSGCYAPEGKVYPEGFLHRRMSKKMCAEIYEGHEVAIHALTHPHLEKMSPAQITHEILTDRINIEHLMGKPIRGMAYPFGTYNDTVLDVLRACGIAYARTVKSTYNFNLPQNWLTLDPTCRHRDGELMTLADKFLKTDAAGGELQMFYLWGHAYEFERDGNWDVIERFTDFMADKDDVWYATNIEIYDYVHAFRELIFDVEQTVCCNPTSTPVWFASGKNTYLVNPNETVQIK